MVKGYNKFNESNRNKGGKNKGNRFQHNQKRSWMDDIPHVANNKTIEPRGMPMEFSDRFKYVLTKIADKGNAIAKELLNAPNKPDARFENSYLDLRGPDNISFIPNSERSVNDKYASNKRQQAKVYKVIKTIFGSKYTSAEVKKFVSFYKQIYQQGPGKDVPKPKLTDEQLAKKLAEDTKNSKIEWKFLNNRGNMSTYEYQIKLTDKKALSFNFFHFPNSHREEMMSFLTVNVRNELGLTDDDKRVWIQTLSYKDLLDFIEVFKDKYKIVVV